MPSITHSTCIKSGSGRNITIAQHYGTHPLNPLLDTHTTTMPGISVRDVEADKFIQAYAAFLKRQGKLPIPGP